MTSKTKIIAIAGPTASGKTSLAINIAKKFNCEIISADSRLIYKDMDIATAKPDLKEQDDITHHLMSIKSPCDNYTVAEFADDSQNIISDIVSRGKTPIVAGGTGLYFRILLEDYDLPRVAPQEELRAELETYESDKLYDLLNKLDPVSAEKIHSNNKVKLIRAIEVCKVLGIPMSQAQGQKESEFDVLWIGLNAANRDFLYSKINQRVLNMVNSGLFDELDFLINKYGDLDIFHNTIGYQELYDYKNGNTTKEEAIQLIQQNTRRYAKRQLSWFRSNKNINWFNIDELSIDELENKTQKLVAKFLQFENN